MGSTISLNPWSVEGLLLHGDMDLAGMLRWAADAGFDSVDIGEIWLRLDPNPDPAWLRRLRSMVADSGLSVSSCWFWADMLAATRVLGSPEKTLAHVLRYFAIAESLGATYVTLQNGIVPQGWSVQQSRSVLLGLYEKLAVAAEEHGVVVSLETARVTSDFNSPQGALDLVREFGSPLVTVTPDFESWRRPRDGRPPLSYPEVPGVERREGLPVEVFADCLPYSPFVHAKFLEFDDSGTDPNIPVDEMFAAVRAAGGDHVFCVEYEGWIPDLFPERDALAETAKAVALLRRQLAAEAVGSNS